MAEKWKKHFKRSPKLWEVERLLKNGARDFYMPASAIKRLSRKALQKIEAKGGRVILEKAAGRPIGVSMGKVVQMVEMHRDERSLREIEKATGVPKSTVHYILKNAQRQKIRKGGKIVYF